MQVQEIAAMSRYRSDDKAATGNWLRPDWPVLTSYDGRNLDRIAMPLGGIGTGTVSLGGRGDLRDWEVANRPAKGFTPPSTFFAIRAREDGNAPFARCLEGPLQPPFEGAHGAPARHANLPRFTKASFHTAYPFAQVVLDDDLLPLRVRIEAFNPLIPSDPDRSGFSVASLRFVVANTGNRVLDVSIAGCVRNFIGSDNLVTHPGRNINQSKSDSFLTGFLMESGDLDLADERWGTIALATIGDGADVTTREAWADHSWGGGILDFWNDFLDDGRLEPRDQDEEIQPVACVTSSTSFAAGEERPFNFVLAWHFPNRQSWDYRGATVERIGNFYTDQFADAWDAATKFVAERESLEADSIDFVRALAESDIPPVFKEAALFNLGTLRSQTCFRTPDGHFFGWEGCNDNSGSCHGNCTHVWNYEYATAHLFGSLSRSMRELEFDHATNDDGVMAFRNQLPLGKPIEQPIAAADGQMGSVMKLYRDWKLCGDDDWLAARWPKARKALEFAWAPGSWDADRDGVMEGCQHNTMDVEYFGPNPEIGFWYLGALRAAEEISRSLDDDEFAGTCSSLRQSGAEWIDRHLFNGEYYEHEIRPITNAEAIHPALRLGAGAKNLVDPEFQIGKGCLADALVGQLMADVTGLGSLADASKISATLASIVRHNYRESLVDHFNFMRTYALGDESGTLNCTWPLGERPARPMPYSDEVWTGIEYTVAAQLVYDGEMETAIELVNAVRNRFDGERRNPFNEAECGHHYARAMASWALVLAATRFHYDAARGALSLTRPTTGHRCFWSTGYAWGTLVVREERDTLSGEIKVHKGSLILRSLLLETHSGTLDNPTTLSSGDVVEVRLTAN
jgi:uncharacterized protein (DUF608 family)